MEELEREFGASENCLKDDRVLCRNCVERTLERQAINTPADKFERLRRENHPAFRWMFEVVKIRNGWARVEYDLNVCAKTKRPCLMDIPQRCHMFKEKGAAQTVELGEVRPWWE